VRRHEIERRADKRDDAGRYCMPMGLYPPSAILARRKPAAESLPAPKGNLTLLAVVLMERAAL